MATTLTDHECDQIADALAAAALYFATHSRLRVSPLEAELLDRHEDNLRAALRLLETVSGDTSFPGPFRKERLDTDWSRGVLCGDHAPSPNRAPKRTLS